MVAPEADEATIEVIMRFLRLSNAFVPLQSVAFKVKETAMGRSSRSAPPISKLNSGPSHCPAEDRRGHFQRHPDDSCRACVHVPDRTTCARSVSEGLQFGTAAARGQPQLPAGSGSRGTQSL